MEWGKKSVVAIVHDDDGEEYEITVIPTNWMTKFAEIEQEAKERGIRFAGITTTRFPEGI